MDRTSRVDLQRFRNEIEAMRKAQESDIANVVPILEFDLQCQPPWYSMPRYQGDLDEVLRRTRHCPRMVASVLVYPANRRTGFPFRGAYICAIMKRHRDGEEELYIGETDGGLILTNNVEVSGLPYSGPLLIENFLDYFKRISL